MYGTSHAKDVDMTQAKAHRQRKAIKPVGDAEILYGEIIVKEH